MKKPLYTERVCYAWGELGNVKDTPPAHNEPGHVWKVRVTDEREQTARQVAAQLVTSMRHMKELDGLTDEQLSNFVWGATGMTVTFVKGKALVRFGAPAPHEWKVGDKFTMPRSEHPMKLYRVHRVCAGTVWYLWNGYERGDVPLGVITQTQYLNTKTWRLYEGKQAGART